MAEKTDIIRRALGILFLVLAMGLLILGETVLNARLGSHPREFIFFWMACFVCVGLTILIALADMAAVRRRVRREERELMENTMREIARVKDEKTENRPEKS